MKIYTKTGDTGNTQVYLSDVKRVTKDDQILKTYGDLDELNSQIGLLIATYASVSQHFPLPLLSKDELTSIQHDIFKIGFAISDTPQLDELRVTFLESKIDELQSSLTPQTHFILPGGSILGANAHICRTIARRSERALVTLSQNHGVPAICLQYINRLSDLLFVAARYFNAQLGESDITV